MIAPQPEGHALPWNVRAAFPSLGYRGALDRLFWGLGISAYERSRSDGFAGSDLRPVAANIGFEIFDLVTLLLDHVVYNIAD